MEKDFWQQAWNDGKTGFHQSEYSEIMVQTFKEADLNNKNVLLPLAGKSNDIKYFLEKGATVIAIEIVKNAILQFFEENKLDYETQNFEGGTHYQAENLHFFHADFFNSPAYLQEFNLKKIDIIYDRASNVALPTEMRRTYYRTIESLKNDQTKFLIITFMHDGPLDFGPPFLIPKDEILQSYKNMKVDLTHTEMNRNTNERF